MNSAFYLDKIIKHPEISSVYIYSFLSCLSDENHGQIKYKNNYEFIVYKESLLDDNFIMYDVSNNVICAGAIKKGVFDDLIAFYRSFVMYSHVVKRIDVGSDLRILVDSLLELFSLTKNKWNSKFLFEKKVDEIYSNIINIVSSWSRECNTTDSLFEAFDALYYFKSRRISYSKQILFDDFSTIGWRMGLNPSYNFDTNFYLENNIDIKCGGVNPYQHYIKFGRTEGRLPCSPIKIEKFNNPKGLKVSVIVPNFNHSKYLKQRIHSIINQSYRNLELIVLDDCSSDDSVNVIDNLLKASSLPTRLIVNDINSGNVFNQWEKGINEADGDIIWICESDDFADPDFLENLVDEFYDPSVKIAFGCIEFATEEGHPYPGIFKYSVEAMEEMALDYIKKPANWWFSNGFQLRNLIPNVSGCLIRNSFDSRFDFNKIKNYKICGDWLFYFLHASNWQIVYNKKAKSYFRQHDKNTSASNQDKLYFYKEHLDIYREISNVYGMNDSSVSFWKSNLTKIKNSSKLSQSIDNLLIELKPVKPTPTLHVMVCFLGFSLGGGEIAPITLANEFFDMGINTCVFVSEYTKRNTDILSRLNKSIPIYTKENLNADPRQLIKDLGVNVLHTHIASMDDYLINYSGIDSDLVDYYVTLHGSYEVISLKPDNLKKIKKVVKHWFYLTENNIKHLSEFEFSTKCTKVINGYPKPALEISPRLNIINNSNPIVCISSRCIDSKGWEQAIRAVTNINAKHRSNITLLLAGDGDSYPSLLKKYSTYSNIQFLGFVDDIASLYSSSDLVLLPTRFPGESYPLALIQAIQLGIPVVATDIGDISKVLNINGNECGVLIPNHKDDDIFVSNIEIAIMSALDPVKYHELSMAALRLSDHFNIREVASTYISYFCSRIDSPTMAT